MNSKNNYNFFYNFFYLYFYNDDISCKRSVAATKRFTMQQTPQVLTIQLKRCCGEGVIAVGWRGLLL